MKRNVDVRGHYKTKTSKTQKKLDRQKEADEALLTWVLLFGKGISDTKALFTWLDNGGWGIFPILQNFKYVKMIGYGMNFAVTPEGLTRLNELTREEANKTKAEEKLAKYKQLFTNQGGARDR